MPLGQSAGKHDGKGGLKHTEIPECQGTAGKGSSLLQKVQREQRLGRELL